MADPCNECGKRHSILGEPSRFVDMEYGVIRIRQPQKCICGNPLPDMIVDDNYYWGEKNKMSKDSRTYRIYQRFDRGDDPVAISNNLGIRLDDVREILRRRQKLVEMVEGISV